MIKKQTINEIYLGNGILIQQYIFYCTTNNTILGGVLEAIDSQGHTFNVHSTSNVETLVLQLSYFIDDTIRIYCEETQKEDDKCDGLSPSECEHFITSNVETLVLQLSYFIDDTIRIYCEETQKEDDKCDGLSPSECEHFINWNKSKEEEEEREEKDIAANRPDPYHADRAAWLAGLGEGTVLL